MRRMTWVVAVAVAVVAAACSGSYTGSKGIAGNLPSAPPDTTRGPADIVIKDGTFVPSADTITLGQVVVFKNFDSTAHTVTSEPGSAEQFDSGVLLFGQMYAHRFTRQGLTAYFDRSRGTDTANTKGRGTILVR